LRIAPKEFEMLTRKRVFSSAGRKAVLPMIAALVLATSESPLNAAPADQTSAGRWATAAASNITDVSSRQRHRHYRRGGNAAGLAFMGLAIGTIAGAIAAQQRRDDCYDYGYCGTRYYYGGGPYYGRRYYYPPY
jgi:hypothetical protein